MFAAVIGNVRVWRETRGKIGFPTVFVSHTLYGFNLAALPKKKMLSVALLIKKVNRRNERKVLQNK